MWSSPSLSFVRPTGRGRLLEHRDAMIVFGADGVVRRLEGDSARLAAAVLAYVVEPRERGELLGHLSGLIGGPVEPVSVVDELVEVLVAAGVLEAAADAATGVARPGSTWPAGRPRRVLLALTGAVQATLAPDLLLRLLAVGHDVRVALTRDARRFVSIPGMEAIGHQTVYRGLWQGGVPQAPHIHLAEWAELMVISPASATTIARIAGGDCSDLVAATAIATRAPVLLVPSMNAAMLRSCAVERNLAQLRTDGFYIAGVGAGMEVAHAPSARRPRPGPSVSHSVVVDLVGYLLGSTGSGEPPAPLAVTGAPAGADGRRVDWEQLYAVTPLQQLPWYTEALDADVAAALARVGGPASRVLDVGTGAGSVAIELARLGHHVTATDVAASVIDRAKARPGAAAVRWLVDDILHSTLDGPFDVVHDRGCLHVLPASLHQRYADTVARLVAPGGHLLLKTDSAGAPRATSTVSYTPRAIAALFAGSFVLRQAVESTFPGPFDPAARALFFVLEREPSPA